MNAVALTQHTASYSATIATSSHTHTHTHHVAPAPPLVPPQTYPEMRAAVLTKLRLVMPDITASEVYRVALWLLGQYSLR